MSYLNKVMLIGNLGRDAELKYTTSGAAVAHFSLATTEVWRDKQGQKQEKTEWHRINVWGKSAEALAEYLSKGKQVYVEGRIQTSEYTDKDGNPRKSVEIRADRVVLLGHKGGNGQQRERHVSDEDMSPTPRQHEEFNHNDVDEESVPF